MSEDHKAILDTIRPMLNDPKVEIRKKVAICLGSLVGTVNDDLFKDLMEQVISTIKSLPFQDEKLFTFIQAVGIFARNAGQRVSVYLKDIVPLLISISTDEKVVNDHSDAAIDLRENCLQTFDVMIIQCPKQMLGHTEDLMAVGLTLMTYDPNYDYTNDDDGDEVMDDADGDDDGFGGIRYFSFFLSFRVFFFERRLLVQMTMVDGTTMAMMADGITMRNLAESETWSWRMLQMMTHRGK